MGKASKSTKKFQSKHLKHTIEQRKKVQDHNKKIAHRKGGKKGSSSTSDVKVDKNQKNAEVFDDINVEEYFEKEDKIPELKNKGKKQEKEEEKESLSSSSSSEDEEEDNDENLDMETLAKDDPEFYNYLKENDKDLLDFSAVNPLDAISDDEEDVDGDEEIEKAEGKESKPETKGSITVDIKLLKKWSDDLKSEKPGLKTLKNIVIAYKSAINTDENEVFKYKVTEEKVFKNLMIIILQDFPLAVQKLTPYKVSSNGIRNISGNKNKVSQVSIIVKAHIPSLITLLEDSSNTETCALVLQSVQELLPYLISFRKLLKAIVNAIVEIWSSSTSLETQISAFAWMNNACKEYPKSVLEIILRSTYSNFLKNCSKTNVHTTPLLNFQKNSAAELFGLNPTLGYQVGFEYIRQLAVHLRGSVNNPTKDSYKAIYNWKFCHGLDFWSRVISVQSADDETENPLVKLNYPLIQVTIGTIRLIPTAQFFPLRFYLIRSLIRLSQNTGVYIPIFPLLSEIFHSTMFSRTPKRENLPAVDFENVIKVNKAYLNTRVYLEGVCEELVELIGEFFNLYCKSVAFPELTTPPLIFLRRFLKKNNTAKGNAKFNRQLNTLVDKLTANSKYIEKQRSHIEYGPKNKVAVSKFLQETEWNKTPLGAYIATQRAVKEEKLKLLRESSVQDEKKDKKTAFDSDEEIGNVESEDDEDEDEDMDSE